MTLRNSIPRLHSVRFKDGRAPLRVLRSGERCEVRTGFVQNCAEIAKVREAMGGYAIVVWGADGGTSVACKTAGNPIPRLLMPEFVKTCVADWVHSP